MATLDADDIAAVTGIVTTAVTNGIAQLLAAIVEGPDQLGGGGEAVPVGHVAAEYNVSLVQAIREVLAFASGPATGLDGPTAVYRSRVGGRNRIVGTQANGNRTITSRDHT